VAKYLRPQIHANNPKRLTVRLIISHVKTEANGELEASNKEGEIFSLRCQVDNRFCPACSPVSILISMILGAIRTTVSRVPLQRPRSGSKLRNKMTGAPIFNSKRAEWRKSPGTEGNLEST
jgi:hypothetical protein